MPALTLESPRVAQAIEHCRHILLCGLGYPDEIELTDADLEEV